MYKIPLHSRFAAGLVFQRRLARVASAS